jgi:hypothetical protein
LPHLRQVENCISAHVLSSTVLLARSLQAHRLAHRHKSAVPSTSAATCQREHSDSSRCHSFSNLQHEQAVSQEQCGEMSPSSASLSLASVSSSRREAKHPQARRRRHLRPAPTRTRFSACRGPTRVTAPTQILPLKWLPTAHARAAHADQLRLVQESVLIKWRRVQSGLRLATALSSRRTLLLNAR